MTANTQPFEILSGVGTIYKAPVGTAFPEVNATPVAPWVSLGATSGGVTVVPEQTTKLIRDDQHTGPRKALRPEEMLSIETNLLNATLENIAILMGNTVTDTAAGAGTIGTRKIALRRGPTVTEYALLFRNEHGSPYGDWPAQYQVPRGFFDGPAGQPWKKDDNILLPVKFVALEDDDASADAERFGHFIAQDASAT